MAKRRVSVQRDESGKPKPTMRAQWLGTGLRRLRESQKITLEEAGDYLQRDGSTLSRMEKGVYPARTPDVLALLDLYGVHDATQRDFLLKLSRDVVEPGWWDQYQADADTTLIDLAWLEARARTIGSYHQMVLPGLLQTAEYARATILAADWTATETQLSRWLELRLARQQVLTRESPLDYVTILDEAAIRRVVGGRGIMAEQLQHLIALARESTVDIRVVPFEAGEHASPDGSFYICDMADPFPAVGYLDTLAGALYVEADTVDRFKSVFDRLLVTALDARESIALIETAAKDLE
ncbi:transcriptional regulator [Actinocatenispora thailandica]|uniref:Transcriptional regulator n=1 Tax=Actinocatenispora thailandica TaxID=227318 RepID=A0A7R7HXF2_9ACTN|nr:helix-turn-helix transcriptional regulator [Actinocatenispora thailandica]BCJ35014.1 transcriptional regulator [Actinocatenispora thailandica]